MPEGFSTAHLRIWCIITHKRSALRPASDGTPRGMPIMSISKLPTIDATLRAAQAALGARQVNALTGAIMAFQAGSRTHDEERRR